MAEIIQRVNPCYCINMKRATNTLTKYYDEIIKTTGLTISQFSLLNEIKYLGICTKGEIAFHAKLDKSTITRNLKTLHEKGVIQDLSVNDSRESQISLTELGQKKIEEGRLLWNKAQKHILEKVGGEKLKELEETLKIIEEIR